MKPVYHTVYEIWNPFTLECIYVGKGNTRKGRKQDHWREVVNFKAGKRVPNKFKSGVMAQIMDMGSEPVFIEIERYETEEEALKEEMRLIAHYGRRILGTGSLTNFNDGGKGNFGHVMPEEAKRKIGISSRGRKISPEAAERKRQSYLAGNYKRTPEQIEAQRQKILGTKASEETLRKKSDALAGKPWTQKRREAHAFGIDPKKGRPWSEETRIKMQEYYEQNPKKRKLVGEYKKKDYNNLTPEQKKNRDKYLRKIVTKTLHVVEGIQ